MCEDGDAIVTLKPCGHKFCPGKSINTDRHTCIGIDTVKGRCRNRGAGGVTPLHA